MIDRETESRVRKAARDGSPIQATDAAAILAELDELRAAYVADTIAVLRERERCVKIVRSFGIPLEGVAQRIQEGSP